MLLTQEVLFWQPSMPLVLKNQPVSKFYIIWRQKFTICQPLLYWNCNEYFSHGFRKILRQGILGENDSIMQI